MSLSSSLARLLLCAGLLVAVPALAAADRPPEDAPAAAPMLPPPDGPGDMHLPFLRGIQLSEAQQDKLFDIQYQQMRTVREHLKILRKTDEELRAMGMAANFDDARARSLIDASSKASAELALLRVRTEHQIYELLTPEQRKQLADAREPRDGRPGPGAHEGPAACPPAPAGEAPKRH